MSEVVHAIRETLGQNSTSSSSFQPQGTSPAHRILGSELEDGVEYVLIARMGLSSSSTTFNGAELDMDEFGIGQISQSFCSVETRRAGSGGGEACGFLAKMTTATPANDYRVRIRSGDGVTKTWLLGSWLEMLKLGGTNGLAASDYAYAEDNVGDTTLSTTLEDGVSVSLPAGNWQIYSFASFKMNSISDEALCQIDVGGAIHARTVTGAGDTVDTRSVVSMTAVNVASTTTVKIQYGTLSGTGPDLLTNRIFAVRLDAFEDHAFSHDYGVTSITSNGTEFSVKTLTHTSTTAASRNWMIAGQATWDTGNSQCRGQVGIDQGANQNVVGQLANNNSPEQGIDNDASAEIPRLVFGEITGFANGVDLDLDLRVLDRDSPGNGQVDESVLVAHTWELAAAGGNNPILGSTSIAVGGAAALRGMGKLTASEEIALSQGASLSGKGALAASEQVAISVSSAALRGVGTLAAAQPISFSHSAVIAGRGALRGSPVVSFIANGVMVAGLQAAASIDIGATATLSGKGKLKAFGNSVDIIAGNANLFTLCTLTGRGSLKSSEAISITATATGRLIGALRASESMAFVPSGLIFGKGRLSAATAVNFVAIGTTGIAGFGEIGETSMKLLGSGYDAILLDTDNRRIVNLSKYDIIKLGGP